MENALSIINDTSSYPTVALPSPLQFEAYARAANAMPMLGPEAEAALVERWSIDQDREAARQLVLSHLRLVVKVVRSHVGYGLPKGELAQEGTVGLMKAVHRFRSGVGVRLAAFALKWIEAEVREFIFRNWRLVRLGTGSAMRKLFFGYRKTLSALKEMAPERPQGVTEEEIASALGVRHDQVQQVAGYFRGSDMSLDPPMDDDDDGQGFASFHAMVPLAAQEQETPEHVVASWHDSSKQQSALDRAWQALPERHQEVLRLRRLREPALGLKEVGQQMGVSAERVRQIEKDALSRLTVLARNQISAPSEG